MCPFPLSLSLGSYPWSRGADYLSLTSTESSGLAFTGASLRARRGSSWLSCGLCRPGCVQPPWDLIVVIAPRPPSLAIWALFMGHY